MDRKDLLREGRNARRRAARRIERLEHAVNSDGITTRMKQWAYNQINEIKRDVFNSRAQNVIAGKTYKRSEEEIRAGISKLERSVKAVPQRYTYEGDSFEVTQNELNKASVNKPSVYTKQEASVFYRATQDIWHRENVGEHSRNEAILDYFNSIREQNDLSPLSFDEIVDYVLRANQEYTDIVSKDVNDLTPEQAEEYGKADNEDSTYTSPSNTNAAVMDNIVEALEGLMVMPDPNGYFGEE